MFVKNGVKNVMLEYFDQFNMNVVMSKFTKKSSVLTSTIENGAVDQSNPSWTFELIMRWRKQYINTVLTMKLNYCTLKRCTICDSRHHVFASKFSIIVFLKSIICDLKRRLVISLHRKVSRKKIIPSVYRRFSWVCQFRANMFMFAKKSNTHIFLWRNWMHFGQSF